jgi:hypothetical protein
MCWKVTVAFLFARCNVLCSSISFASSSSFPMHEQISMRTCHESVTRFDVNDVHVSGIEFLRGRKFNDIGLIGHSFGGAVMAQSGRLVRL